MTFRGAGDQRRRSTRTLMGPVRDVAWGPNQAVTSCYSRIAIVAMTLTSLFGNTSTGDDPKRQREAVEASDPGIFRAYRGWVGHVRHQRISRNLTEQPGLEVLPRLPTFGSSVHHKGSIGRDRFANGPATQDEQLQGRTLRDLGVITSDLEPVAAAEHRQ